MKDSTLIIGGVVAVVGFIGAIIFGAPAVD